MTHKPLLIVDDEPGMRLVLSRALAEAGYEPMAVSTAEEALSLVKEDPPPVAIVDINLPGMDGITFLQTIKKIDDRIVVLIITGYADMDTAIASLRAGAYDFIPKPFRPDLLVAAVDRAYEKIDLTRKVEALSQPERGGFERIVGESETLRREKDKARRIAPTDEAVLITGESGTGKELFARAIHENSPRRRNRYMVVNCAAIPEHLLESELFGHKKGAFTGAGSDRMGLIEAAHGGTVFFDEIGEINPSVQVKLLRFLQDHRIRRVGETHEIEVDVRVIVATNRDLKAAAEEGSFRDDLYYRLRVLEISIPPLRERKGDVQILVDHYLSRVDDGGCRGTASFSPEALQILLDYPWPGNVRELENLMKQITVLCTGTGIGVEDLPSYITSYLPRATPPNELTTAALDQELTYSEAREQILADFNREIITQALSAEDGNISRASERLKTPKSNLLRLMKKYGIASARQHS